MQEENTLGQREKKKEDIIKLMLRLYNLCIDTS